MPADNVLNVAFFQNRTDNQPRCCQLTWDKLAGRLTQHCERGGKDGPLWSPAHYTPKTTRANRNVLAVTAAVGDFDNGTNWEDVKERLSGFEYVAHSTHSSDPEHPKFRVVIPFSTPVACKDWPEIRERIDYHVFGLDSDPSTKDASRAYYLPSCQVGALRFAERHTGDMLNPRELQEAPHKERVNGAAGSDGPRMPLGKAALDFVANGAPVGEQRGRALAATRNYLSAGHTVDETTAAIWRGLGVCQQEQGKPAWTEADAYQIVTNISASPAPIIVFPDRVVIEDGPVPSGFRKAGMGYVCEFPASHITFTVDRLRRSSEGMSGEVLVEADLPAIPQHLHWARLNLSSTSARSTLVKFLKSRTEGIDIDFVTMLEILCRKVALADRAGDPFVETGKDDPEANTWLVKAFAPLGEAMTVYGDGGVGKSMLALAIALSVKTGREFVPGFTPLNRGNVLYLDWEAGRARVNARIQALCRGQGIDPEQIHYRRCAGPLTEQIEDVLRYCDDNKIVQVTVDSVEMAMSGSGGDDGNPNDKVVRLHSALRLLKTTSILVDHIAAASIGNSGIPGKPIGGVFKRNLARVAYEMRKGASQSDGCLHVALYNKKRNDDGDLFPTRGLKVEFGPGLARFTRDDVRDIALVEGMSIPEQIDSLLADGSRSRKFITDNVQGRPGSVEQALNRGGGKRWRVLSNGEYGLPESRREATTEAVYDIPF